jgi:predicted nucleotidyltransferase
MVFRSIMEIIDMTDVIRQRRDKIMQLADKYGAKNIRVFGSFARGDDNSESDADFLVNMEGSLLRRIAFMQDLEDLLGRKVDVVTEKSIHWYVRESILKEAVPL